jgi:uncharacterized protein (TIGR00730 family)
MIKQSVAENAETVEIVEQALQSVWAVANKLSRIAPPDANGYAVTVFGSARIKPGEALYENVKALTKRLSEMRCNIITGGGPGLMQAANEGSQLGDPNDELDSIGIRVKLPFEAGANPFVEQAYTHETFYTRLHQFVRLSDAFICVGGGIGTTLELLLVWQLLQVKHIKSIPFVLVGDMWGGLVAWSKEHMLSHEPQFASPDDLDIPVCVSTIDEAIEHLAPHIAQFHELKQSGDHKSR